jgi:MFS family permease
MTALAEAPPVPSPWRGAHGRTTVGVFALAFLFAFEALAVATVMPDVAADLDGLALYSVAFSAPMAAGVVALVLAGPWTDARGPRSALAGGVAVFSAGVLLAGLAPTMELFLVGRLVHGLGAGVLGVALYVVIAQGYPEELRPRVFAVLTSAWVLPALVGPVLAAYVAGLAGWRWVFLGVPLLAVPAWLLVRGAGLRGGGVAVSGERPRVGLALLAAVGVLGVSVAGQRELPGWPVLLGLSLVAVAAAGRRLLPTGTWRFARGVPSMLAARALIGTAFAAAEVYVPLLLVLQRELTLAEAGWVLTSGAVTWCAGAWTSARLGLSAESRVRLGAGLVAVGVAAFLTALAPLPLVVPVLAWAVAGFGIGMAFSTLSVLVLGAAPAGEEGRLSSALQLNDSLAQATAMALGSAVFAGFAISAPVTGAGLLVGAAALLGVVALVPAARLRRG